MSSSAGHPRSRGEHIFSGSPHSSSAGSSPLARGTHTVPIHRMTILRVIPARAGNTAVNRIRLLIIPGHPRSRGEHVIDAVPQPPLRGSSPLARGTRSDQGHLRPVRRVIPARAGNTRRKPRGQMADPGHPRSRGEHTQQLGHLPVVAGSSPLARGTRDLPVGLDGHLRVIPARAGNTAPRRPSSS